MICVIHQAEHFSYLGIFYKILQSDIFVILDNSGYRHNYFDHRNKIRTKDKWQYIVVPNHASFLNQPLNELLIDYPQNWQIKYLKSISQNYSKAPYFKEIYPTIAEIIYTKWNNLAELNIKLLEFILKKLEYKGKIYFSSQMDLNSNLKATDLLIEICKQVGATGYLSGKSGKDYLETEKFKDNNIILSYSEFKHPIYKQVYPGFIENLSILDLLMNDKENARAIILGEKDV